MGERVITLDRLKSLVEKYSIVNSCVTNPDSLLNSLLDSVKKMVNCDAAYLLLVRKETGDFEFAVCLGANNSEVKKLTVEKNSIAGWVAEHKEAVIVNDVTRDSRFNSKVQDKIKYKTRNMIVFPLTIEGECVGICLPVELTAIYDDATENRRLVTNPYIISNDDRSFCV